MRSDLQSYNLAGTNSLGSPLAFIAGATVGVTPDLKPYLLNPIPNPTLGMGCSASVIAIDLAKDLLNARGRNGLALVVSTENLTQNLYLGDGVTLGPHPCRARSPVDPNSDPPNPNPHLDNGPILNPNPNPLPCLALPPTPTPTLGNDRSMLLQNTLFRCGGAAMLLSNSWAHAHKAKYVKEKLYKKKYV